ncbi:nitrate ABC transporter permease [Paenibacillus jamilae]|uniref:ABC transporter permease n=1 Tax=Paenibacillus jamilae TaxID=114136 RepID=UPI0007AB7670|nr:ABC transporter permease [Paenibacillus jamilae]KZE70123.1 nitrate ABC transporter permease [Paenibacillus jamilae]
MNPKGKHASWWKSVWPPLVAVLFFLAAWQEAVSYLHIESWLLPAPALIVQEGMAQSALLGAHTWATIRLTLAGFAIGTATGLLIAIVLHIIPFLKSALYPLLILSQNIPIIALGPLLMVWFGFGVLPKLMVITLVCFFPVAVAAMDGLTRTDRVMMNYMQMSGASRRAIFMKLELPHSLPQVFSGIKIAATYSVMGAIIAEWIGASEGIGYYMLLQKSAYRTDLIFAAIGIIVTLSLLMFVIILLLEKWLVRWKPDQE